MSSRALRRLQKDSGIGLDFAADEENEDIKQDSTIVDDGITTSKQQKKRKGKKADVPLNPFELLNNGPEDHGSLSDKEEDNENNEEEAKSDLDKAIPKSKKKKKSKKKQKVIENIVSDTTKEAEDEVEASIQEVNRILGEANLSYTNTEKGQGAKSASMKSLLHIDHRNLNPENELKKIFGSQVIRGEQQQDRSRRQRNRPLQRSSRLVQPKEGWHPTGGSGLSMTYLGEDEGFTFEHSPVYQKQQFEFYDAVESGHPEAIVNILRKQPYHIDSLIQMADFHRVNEDFQVGAEFIEKAMYGLECAFHSRFNMAAGNCHLPYNRPENRPFYLCVFKHIMHLGRRGCNRTAFEFCKLLLSLDPSDDPLDCMSMIDFYALRSDQYDYLLRLEEEALTSEASRQVPNFAFSIALAHFKDALKRGCDIKTSDERLQDALIFFPVMLIPLLDQCCVQPDKRVSSHPFFNSKELLDVTSELGRLVTLYVKRCESCWKEMDVMSWLERNVLAVLDIVDSGLDKRIKDYAELRKKGFKKPPLSLLRHYFLSEIQGVSPPQRFTTSSVLGYDPFPPPRSIISYTRPARPAAAPQNTSGLFRSFIDSLRPSYNPNDPAGERNLRPARNEDEDGEEGAAGGARAIPGQIQDSVNALMEAMRQLLNDPFAAHQQHQEMPREDEEEADNDGEWEDERPDNEDDQR